MVRTPPKIVIKGLLVLGPGKEKNTVLRVDKNTWLYRSRRNNTFKIDA